MKLEDRKGRGADTRPTTAGRPRRSLGIAWGGDSNDTGSSPMEYEMLSPMPMKLGAAQTA